MLLCENCFFETIKINSRKNTFVYDESKVLLFKLAVLKAVYDL